MAHNLSRAARLAALFPHAKAPLIVSAPMLGVSNGTLAAAVSAAGGLGCVPGGYDFRPGSPQLTALDAELTAARAALDLAGSRAQSPLPLAVGFILCHESAAHFAETVLPLLRAHSPQAVWLFAPDPAREDKSAGSQQAISGLLRGSGFTVVTQVGTVAAAKKAAADGADVIIAQGGDAGGHQFAQGASVISLVPETRAMLDREFPDRTIFVAAAGGIVDGRGVAASLALGADGAVMGTRFILSKESLAPDHRRKTLLATTDGGVSTIKSTFHDTVQGTAIWPGLYDGRAVVGDSYRDHASGVPIDENVAKFKAAKDAGEPSRLVHWAGTGVGLIDRDLPAGDIVKEVREAAIERIRDLQALL